MEPNSSPNTPAAAADASVRVPGAPHEPTGRAPGAHTDTFARDHLPRRNSGPSSCWTIRRRATPTG